MATSPMDKFTESWLALPEIEQFEFAARIAMHLAERGRYTPAETYRGVKAALDIED